MAAGNMSPEVGPESYRPLIERVVDADSLPDSIAQETPLHVFDTYKQQVGEWLKIRRPQQPYSPEELDSAVDAFIADASNSRGNWVYYPWMDTVVRILDEEMFAELRTSRNQYKIKPEEQKALAGKTIGIVGLSVGQSAAVTLAMEAVGGVLRIADFDTLDLSNLNRLRAGLHQLGLPKTVIAAREIAQIDPYIKIEVFHEGVQPTNAVEFMTGLDILVEECDSLPIKIMLRKIAQQMKMPVIMDTSDRGMVDVERFDIEQNRPIFHGRLQPFEGKDPASFTEEDKRNLLFALVDYEKASDRAKASFAEIGKSITTWPQLASAVNLGGAMMTDTARRILLGHDVKSGRYYVDLEQLIGGDE
ncbi:ThiF family adenylyltransferase [Phaeocystidibacter luteus]|uniref:THIF-type NAD/FAD binding fold domain-containing protein n=1 Tax=Phaeocystidibacter luteus TaxID=911197 RepID=A0A6N6RK32_9FLAO|nr:ThiF family adenylyltransferase [Phaeocystidibacter luteus]KAB2814245.1 hypothetical protein F8C67_00515 [Phaeocystidibacter luteus]